MAVQVFGKPPFYSGRGLQSHSFLAITMSSCKVPLSKISESPNQPGDYSFLSRKFGKSNIVSHAFQSSWFARWKWLHYDATQDLVFCHTCVVVAKTGKMKLGGNMKDSIFLSGGFSNWKDATVGFVKHEKTMTHKIAVDLIEVLPCTTRDVGEMLSSVHAAEKAVNRHCLLKIAENIHFLAQQGLPLRGNYDGSDSNFFQLLRLRAVDDMQLRLWMK